jgi:hypothetical protein
LFLTGCRVASVVVTLAEKIPAVVFYCAPTDGGLELFHGFGKGRGGWRRRSASKKKKWVWTLRAAWPHRAPPPPPLHRLFGSLSWCFFAFDQLLHHHSPSPTHQRPKACIIPCPAIVSLQPLLSHVSIALHHQCCPALPPCPILSL